MMRGENTGGRVKQDNKSGWRREVYDRMEREARPRAVFDLQESLYLHFTLSQRDTAKTVRVPCTICLIQQSANFTFINN